MLKTTSAIDISDDVYFFVQDIDGGTILHLQSRTNSGMIDLTPEELEKLYNMTKGNINSLKILYGTPTK